MRHAVIMAGGAGTRLWPLSRQARPKQFMRLFDGCSLLKLARQRLSGLFGPANIWVITSAKYLDLVAAELPDLPRENLIGEPLVRDTANAIGLAANLLALRDPDATMAVFTADHLIGPQDKFAAGIRAGLAAAEQNPTSLVTFGIIPTSASTAYGYVRKGDQIAPSTYRALEFKEKPPGELAEEYLRRGDYLWNSGMFAWRVAAILAELERHLPDNARTLAALAADWERVSRRPEVVASFEGLHRISVDHAVMEKAASVLLVELTCQWMDVGSWPAIGSTGVADQAGNVVIGQTGVVVGGRNNVLVSEEKHLLVTLGVSDVIVVHSSDATLVCHRDHDQELRELARLRRERFGEQYE